MTDETGTPSAPGAAREPAQAQRAAYLTMSKRSDFLAANRGQRVARPGFVLLANRNGGQGRRAGITVTKKIGNAVVRNRMKRRFRALLREILPEHGFADTDHVLIGREGGVERDFASLREELLAALARIREGKVDPPRGARRGKGGPKGGGKGTGRGGQHRARGRGETASADSPAPKS